MMKVIETYGNKTSTIINYNLSVENTIEIESKKPKIISSKINSYFHLFFSFINSMLLPVGYPRTVAPEYIKFQIWDTLQECCGYFKKILISQAWIKNLGVGDPSANVLNAIALTMVLDYIKMIVGIMIGTPYIVLLFSSDMKQWRMVSEYVKFICDILMLLSNILPKLKLKILIFHAITHTIANVCGNISHAPLIRHLALAKNESDVAAKEGNQSRILKSVAIIGGYYFLIFVNNNYFTGMCAFLLLAFLKIIFQYKATTVLEFRTINHQRMELLFNAYLSNNKEYMSKKEIAKMESTVYDFKTRGDFAKIILGVSLASVIKYTKNVKLQPGENYAFCPDHIQKDKIQIVLSEKSDYMTELRAVCHAILYKKLYNDKSSDQEIESLSHDKMSKCFDDFVNNLDKNGWEKNSLLFKTDLFRSKWD